jgi:signal recognition particle receptor subunit beta
MGADLDWSSFKSVVTNLLDGNPIAILVTVLIAVGCPLLLHYFLYRKAAAPASSSFLLLGPSGAGKTALFTLVTIPSNYPRMLKCRGKLCNYG